MADPNQPPDGPDSGLAQRTVRRPRAESREVTELRALRQRYPELSQAADLHIEIVELHRRIQNRVPLPWFEVSGEILTKHNASGRPLLSFDHIPLELSDLRLMVRLTADALHRFGALEDADFRTIHAIGRDTTLLGVIRQWFRGTIERHAPAAAAVAAAPGEPPVDPQSAPGGVVDQVLTLAMRPFLSRCAEILQTRSDLSIWSHAYCALCGAEPDFSVITPAAERHLVCGRCTLRWKFGALTCPFCRNSDRSSITSFATPDGQYRVYGCDRCHRYLKAYDNRLSSRPLMPLVDAIATLPLDAAAIQRGYIA